MISPRIHFYPSNNSNTSWVSEVSKYRYKYHFLIVMMFSCTTEDFTNRVPEVEKNQFMEHGDNWRDLRYGEIIPVWRSGINLYMEVYNSVQSNELPQDLWDKLDNEKLKKELGAVEVILNGPRYWVINQMDGKGATANGKVANFGGIEMTQRAVLESSIFSGATKPIG